MSNVDESLLEVLGNSSALDLVADLGEISIDQFIEGDALRDIPIIGTLIGLAKTGSRISAFYFTRKLLKFLQKIHEIPDEERQKLLREIGENKSKVADHLLLALDRLDDLDKPNLLAIAFSGFLRGQVDLAQFRALAAAIDRCLISDLDHLVAAVQPAHYPADVAVRLSGCGLIEVRIIPDVPVEGVPNQYRTTSFGRLFSAVVLGKP